MHGHGLHIVFEGIDGSGKSSLSAWLRTRLPGSILTREPSDGPIGTFIRSQAHDMDVSDYTDQEWATLFQADRLHHVRTVIVPAMEEGKIVISDRYALSTYVYQDVDDFGPTEAWPHLVILLDIPGSVAARRIAQRGERPAVFETELEARRQKYWQACEDYFERWCGVGIVNADQDIEEVHREVWQHVHTCIDAMGWQAGGRDDQ